MGEEGVEETSERGELMSAAAVDSLVSWSKCSEVVVTLRSDGKTALMTGLVRSPTRPSCTA